MPHLDFDHDDGGRASPRRRRGSRAAFPICAALLALSSAGGGCAKQAGSGGAGGDDTSVSSASSSSGSSTSGGEGGTGGSGGVAGSGGAGATGGAIETGGGGTGGASTGGAGGMGNGCVIPAGTADYPLEMEQNNLKATANPLAAGTKGFTAGVCPAGDVDIFAVDVVIPDSILTVSTSDGAGGCPAGAATYVRVFNAQGQLLGADTNAGPDSCSELTPQSKPALANLAVGTYYVQVESADINPIASYVVDIHLTSPLCGDGLVQLASGEQCDDGNLAPNDGCSPTCEIEANYTVEIEGNDTQDAANPLDGYDGVIAAISPIGDHDFFSVTVTVPGSSIKAEVTDGYSGCPAGLDTKIHLLDPNKVELAFDDNGGVAACSLITPVVHPGAKDLQPGVYAIEVEENGNDATPPFYVLNVKVSAPGCGDGLLQPGEQCDEGDVIAGDGCSPTCQFEANFANETEPNGTSATGNLLPAGYNGFFASINPLGDNDFFKFDVPVQGSSVRLEVTAGWPNSCPAGFDSKIYLYDHNDVLIALDDDLGVNKCSLLSPATSPVMIDMAAGTYTVKVEEFGNDALQAAYVLEIEVTPPGCGDGLLQPGEQCEDGNVVSGDGCTDVCTSEAPFEIEANDTFATATPPWPGFSYWKGTINYLGDHDYFSFTLAAPGSPTLTVHEVGDVNACTFDTVIHLLDSTGMQIVQDDDDGPNKCSMISPVLDPVVNNLPAGTYYVWVQRFNDLLTIPLYQLDLSVQ